MLPRWPWSAGGFPYLVCTADPSVDRYANNHFQTACGPTPQENNALQSAVHHHNGHTYLSVRNLPSSAVITLSADGDLTHPVNVTPPEPPTEVAAQS